jgi:hypothetical protein
MANALTARAGHARHGDLTPRIESSAHGVVLAAHALAKALTEANRLLALY